MNSISTPPSLNECLRTIEKNRGKVWKNEYVYRERDVRSIITQLLSNVSVDYKISDSQMIITSDKIFDDRNQLIEEINSLHKECTEYKRSYSVLLEDSKRFELINNDIQDAISRIFTVITNLNNDILDGKKSEDLLSQNIEELKSLMSPINFTIYYCNRGDLFPEDSVNYTPDSFFIKTNDPALDHRVYRCNSIGYRMDRYGLRCPARVSLYQYEEE